MALLTSGPINDEGWNQTAYEGLLAIKEKHGATIANTENVAQADQLDLIRSYANQGFTIIVGHGFEYGDALTTAAEEFPDVTFIQIGGIASNGKNLVSYVFKPGEGGYVAGVLAALMTESNKLGGVGAMEIPTIAADFKAFEMAAQARNPETSVTVAYTGSWVDIPKAKEAALAQAEAGVDVILANGDNANVGAIQAAQEKGIYAIGWTRDQSHLAPEVVLTSVEQRLDVLLVEAVDSILAGTMRYENHSVGMAEGIQRLAPFGPMVPQSVQDEVLKVVAQIEQGEIDLPSIGE